VVRTPDCSDDDHRRSRLLSCFGDSPIRGCRANAPATSPQVIRADDALALAVRASTVA